MLLAITVVISELPMYNALAAEQSEYVVTEAEMEADDAPAVEETDQVQSTMSEDIPAAEETVPTQAPETELESIAEETDQVQSTMSEGIPVAEETVPPRTIESEIFTTDEKQRNSYSQASDYGELELSEDGKMAGSNGILYDDVVYLSAKIVLAMDEETQRVYYNICDEIASCKESGFEIQDAVIAVDGEGTIHYSSSVPMIVLDKIQADMAKGISEKLDLSTEIKETNEPESKQPETKESEIEKLKIEESTVKESEIEESKVEEFEIEESKIKESETEESEEESTEIKESQTEEESAETEESETEDFESEIQKSEESESESLSEEHSSTEETLLEESEIEESQLEESSIEESEIEESSIEETTTDEEASEAQEETTIEEASELETLSEEESIVEETKMLLTDEALEIDGFDLILTEENMDCIPDLEEETFDTVESIKVKNIIDLGYGVSGNTAQISSILPTEGYFYNQLTAAQRKYYDAAKARFLSGNNSFSYIGPYQNFNWEPVCHAVSALVLTYPDKMDWAAKPGNIHMKYTYRRGSSTANMVFTLDKSKYYSGTLNSKAKTQIQTLANAAQQYAIEQYPQAPVYGIITYFDDWICANNYYNYTGTETITNKTPNETRKIYYYCHSAYGILLNGYGVCESYAKAMSRLLDAIGIPNTYVVGDAGGGHAWNYVQMPDGNWYMVDSTWNDNGLSTKEYLLVPDDGVHKPTGTGWTNERTKFKFPTLAAVRYEPNLETIAFTKQSIDLKPKETIDLMLNDGDFVKNAPKTWTSSNSKVAKVSSKGKITAVAPGTATITLAAAGMTTTCEVSVDQVKSLVSSNTNKTSDTISFGMINGQKADAKTVVLNVNMGNSPHTAEWMRNNQALEAPNITYTNKKVNVAQASVEGIRGNQMILHIQPMTVGTTTVKVAFAGKTASIKVAVGNAISPNWFEIAKFENNATPYTGKAIRPRVTKTTKEKITYKVTYLNNKNAGTATVKITGTGKYGGEIVYPFEITPIDISNADFSKALKAKVYNGGVCAPATTVKLGKKTLKANTDYTILYDGEELEVVPAKSSYTISIKGKGNYTGIVSKTQNYTVNKNTIAKVTAACSSVKYTGAKLNPVTVKIGKNVLPKTDYQIIYHQGSKNGAVVPYPLAKGKYTAVITVTGDNVISTAKKTEIVKSFTVK